MHAVIVSRVTPQDRRSRRRLRTGGQFREEAGLTAPTLAPCALVYFPLGCRTSVRRFTRFRRRLMVFAAGVVQSPLNGCAIPLRAVAPAAGSFSDQSGALSWFRLCLQ